MKKLRCVGTVTLNGASKRRTLLAKWLRELASDLMRDKNRYSARFTAQRYA